MLMKDIQQTTSKLRQLKEMGFSISVDDFGTGFSSLNYLRHFPLDVLKIDQSFVRELFEDDAALAIIDSIIAWLMHWGCAQSPKGWKPPSNN